MPFAMFGVLINGLPYIRQHIAQYAVIVGSSLLYADTSGKRGIPALQHNTVMNLPQVRSVHARQWHPCQQAVAFSI